MSSFSQEIGSLFLDHMTLDGVGKSLNMDIDIFGMLNADIKDIIGSTYDKNDILEELVWASRDVLPIIRIAPRYLKWWLKDFSRKIINSILKTMATKDI